MNSKNVNGKKEKLFHIQTESVTMRQREDAKMSLHSLTFLITSSLFPCSVSNVSFRRCLDPPTCRSPAMLVH
jgi:hypothetical protein